MAGAKIERLLHGIEAIYADLGDLGPGAEELPTIEPDDCRHPLGPDAEVEIAAVLRTLRRIGAAARRASTLPEPPPLVPRGALGGAVLLMRSDYLLGHGADIPARLPAFVYVTTLIFLDQDEAGRRCREVEELIEAEGFAAG